MRPLPAPRLAPYRSASWDSDQQVVVVFGGEGGREGTVIYDPWRNQWRWPEPVSEPPSRSGGNMAYDDALGRPVEVATDYAVGKRCVYPLQDYRAYREACKTAPTSFISWVRPWFGALQPIHRLTDPMPVIKSTLDVLGRKIDRRMYGMINLHNKSR